MDKVWPILIAPIVLGVLGLFLGILISVVAKFFGVEEDHRIEEVENMLPKYNCGACGYAGCHDMAKAMLEGKCNANGCKPIKAEDRDSLNKFLDELLKGNQPAVETSKK